MSPPGPRSRSGMTLYSAQNCPRSHAIRLVLALKGLPHELVYVDPKRPPSDWQALASTANLPTLIERDVVLYEPRIIAEYLDERFPHPPLLPSDPLGRARARLMMFRIEQEWLVPLARIASADADTDTAKSALQALRAGLAESEPLFRLAKFFCSPEIGLADCMLLPLLWRLPTVGIDRQALGVGIHGYAQRLMQTPLFQHTLSEAERALVQ